MQTPSAPSAMAPQMPRPPFQIFSGVDRVAALAPVRAGRGDDVVEPAADDAEEHPHAATSRAWPGSPPRATSRRPVSHTATTMPTRMHRAYIRIGQRSEVEDPDGGAREVRGHLVAFWMAWVSSSGVAMVESSTSSPLIITVGVPWKLGILKAASFTELTYLV